MQLFDAGDMNIPTTMTLKLKPFRTLLRCHWFGRLAKPTKPVSFLRTMFLISLAAAAAALGSFDDTVWGVGELGPVDMTLLRSTKGATGFPLAAGTAAPWA